MNKRKTGFLYGSILLAAIIFFLFYLFPGERVNQHVIHRIHGLFPDYDVNITGSGPALPMGLNLYGVSVSHLESELFAADKIKLGVPIFSFFSKERRFSITAKTYGGEIKGVASLNRNESESGIQKVALIFELAGIRIDEIPAVDKLVNPGVTGLVSGTVDIDASNPAQQALIQLRATKVSFPLANPVLNLGNMDFNDIAIEGILNRDELTIKLFDAKGSQANCGLSGKIQFKDPVEESMLNLSGRIEPHHELLKKLQTSLFPVKSAGTHGIPFDVTGTFQKPEFLLR